MFCEHCGQEMEKGKITDTEFGYDKKLLCYTVRRRRTCVDCKKKTTTVELNRREVLEWLREKESCLHTLSTKEGSRECQNQLSSSPNLKEIDLESC